MTRREDGRWVETMTVKVNGRNVRKYFYGQTKREVLNKIADYEEEKEQGKYWQEVCDDWWKEYEPTIAYNSCRNTKPAYERARVAFVGKRCRELTPALLSLWLQKTISERHMAEKTASTQLNVIRHICKYAVLHESLETNIARELDLPSGLKKGNRGLPAKSDIEIIKQYDGNGSQGAMYAFWAAYTGMRKGELLGLRWEDIDLENREIWVVRSVYHVNNTPKTKEPKTEAGIRIIPIMDKLATVIPNRKRGWVFGVNGELMTETQYQIMWEHFKKESGISCTAHQLRHMLATLLLENDIPVEKARIILGHADSSTTERIYQHIRTELRRRESVKVLSLEL